MAFVVKNAAEPRIHGQEGVRWTTPRWSSRVWPLVLASGLLACAGTHPSDDVLVAAFGAHRADYELLRSMVIEDDLRLLSVAGVDWHVTIAVRGPAMDDLEAERAGEYREVMRRANVLSISNAYNNRFVEFGVSEAGWPQCLTRKVFVAADGDPRHHDARAPMVGSLDGLSWEQAPALRAVSGHWYLYLEKCGG